MIEKSKDHIQFSGENEFYLFNGSVYRADVNRPVMPDGYRCGRWFCSREHFKHTPQPN